MQMYMQRIAASRTTASETPSAPPARGGRVDGSDVRDALDGGVGGVDGKHASAADEGGGSTAVAFEEEEEEAFEFEDDFEISGGGADLSDSLNASVHSAGGHSSPPPGMFVCACV